MFSESVSPAPKAPFCEGVRLLFVGNVADHWMDVDPVFCKVMGFGQEPCRQNSKLPFAGIETVNCGPADVAVACSVGEARGM
jgi:hypothetical protein